MTDQKRVKCNFQKKLNRYLSFILQRCALAKKRAIIRARAVPISRPPDCAGTNDSPAEQWGWVINDRLADMSPPSDQLIKQTHSDPSSAAATAADPPRKLAPSNSSAGPSTTSSSPSSSSAADQQQTQKPSPIRSAPPPPKWDLLALFIEEEMRIAERRRILFCERPVASLLGTSKTCVRISTDHSLRYDHLIRFSIVLYQLVRF